MIKLDCNNFFKFFIYNTTSDYLSSKDQKIAYVSRKILSFFSLTLIPRLCKKKWAPTQQKFLKENIQKAIKSSQAFPLTDKKAEDDQCSAAKVPCTRILNGLFLGNAIGFVEATELECTSTSNSHRFNSVISYCPTGHAISTYAMKVSGDFTALTASTISESFKNQTVNGQKFNWLNHGEAVLDDEIGWLGLVHDSTYSTTTTNLREDEIEKMLTEKNEKIRETNIEDWFKTTFDEIDGAVFHKKRVLVHCQAGVSRSASVLAAYLINRFDVTADEALAFLKSKRYCVKSKFTAGLQTYQQALSAQRAAAAAQQLLGSTQTQTQTQTQNGL